MEADRVIKILQESLRKKKDEIQNRIQPSTKAQASISNAEKKISDLEASVKKASEEPALHQEIFTRFEKEIEEIKNDLENI